VVKKLSSLGLMLIYLPTLGCGLTLGPTVKTEYVLVTPGNPILVLENRRVEGRRLDGAGVASFDIGGWVAMPEEHFAALKRAAEAVR